MKSAIFDGVPSFFSTDTELLAHHPYTTMASAAENSSPEGTPAPPYMWKDNSVPSEDDLRLWQEVAEQLEKQQTGERRSLLRVDLCDLFGGNRGVGDFVVMLCSFCSLF